MDEKERQAIVYALKEEEEEKIGCDSVVNVNYSFNNNYELSFKQVLSEIENNSDLGEEILKTISKKARSDLWYMVKKGPGIKGKPSRKLLEEATFDEYCAEVVKRMKQPDKKTGFIGGHWHPTYKEFVEKIIQEKGGMQNLYSTALTTFEVEPKNK